MIYSYDLETQLLAGLIKYPERYADVASFITEKDFWSESSKINRTIFCVLRQATHTNCHILFRCRLCRAGNCCKVFHWLYQCLCVLC